MFLLCLQDELLVLPYAVHCFLDVVLLDQGQLDLPVEVQEQTYVLDCVHSLNAVFDVVKAFSQRQQA